MATKRIQSACNPVFRAPAARLLMLLSAFFCLAGYHCFAFSIIDRNAEAENSEISDEQPLTAQIRMEVLPVGDDCFDHLIQMANASGFDARDQIWFIDARQSHFSDIQCLNIYRVANQLLVKQELADLIEDHQSDTSRVTVAYVHGDRTDEFYAQYRGVQVYQNLFANDCGARPPVRFIIWSWKSEKEILRPGKDFRVKSTRSRCVGQSFALFLNRFPDQRILLTGYSLGCQVFLEAMQEPEILQRKSADDSAGYRLALIAPAMDGDFLSSIKFGNSVCPPIQETHIFDNSRDRILKLARFHSRRTSPNAGSSIPGLLKNGNLGYRNVFWYDLANSVGPYHAINNYTKVPLVRKTMQELANSLQMEFRAGFEQPPEPVADSLSSIPTAE
jgi:hypothetical protein